MNANRPEPCRYRCRFAPADEDANYVADQSRFDACLGEGRLWLSKSLVIPIASIRAQELLKRGSLIRRFALRIVFYDEARRVRDAVHLCDINWLGLYRADRLAELSKALDDAAAEEDLPAIASDADVPMFAARRGFFGIMYRSAVGLFRSDESLAMEFYRANFDHLDLPAPKWTDVDAARRAFRRESAIRGTLVDAESLPELERRYAVGTRLTSFWLLLTGLALPALITVDAMAESTDSNLIGRIVAGIFLFGILVLPCFLAGTVLERVFTWLGARLNG